MNGYNLEDKQDISKKMSQTQTDTKLSPGEQLRLTGRGAKLPEWNEEDIAGTENMSSEADISASLRAGVQQSKLDAEEEEEESEEEEQATAVKAGSKAKIREKDTVGFATSKLLRGSWFLLPTLFGSLVAIPYINLHIMGRFAFGEQYFCKLGNEWRSGFFSKDKITPESWYRAIGMLEIFAILVFDLIFIVGVLLILGFLMAIFGGTEDSATMRVIKQVIQTPDFTH